MGANQFVSIVTPPPGDGVDWQTIAAVVSAATLTGVLAVSLYWWRRLRREVAERTEALQNANAVLRQEVSRRTAAEASAAHRLARLELIHGISNDMNEGMSVDEILSRAIRDLHSAFPELRAGFWQVTRQRIAHLTHVASAGGPAGLDHRVGLPTDSYIPILRDGEVIRIGDAWSDPRTSPFVESCRRLGIRGLLDAPVLSGGEVVGRLTLDSPAPRDWGDMEAGTLEIAAGYIAAALRAAAFEQEKANAIGKLVQSEERYRELFESHPLPMWIYCPKTLRVLDANAAAIQVYGYSRDEWLAMNVDQFRPAEERVRLREHMGRGLPEGITSSGLWRHLKKNGEIFTVEVFARSISYSGHQARLVVSVDMTPIVEQRLALIQERRRHQQMLDAVEIGWEWNAGTDEVVWGSSLCELLGYGHGRRTSAREFLLAIAPEGRRPVERLFETALWSEPPASENRPWTELTCRMTTAQRKVVPVQMTIRRQSDGESVIGWIGGAGPRVGSDAARLRSDFSKALALCGAGEWTLSADHQFWASPDAWRILGVSDHKAGAALLDCVHPDDRARVSEAIGRALAGNGTLEITHRLASDAGQHVRHVASVDESGGFLTGVCRDVTEELASAARLRQTEIELARSQEELARVSIVLRTVGDSLGLQPPDPTKSRPTSAS